MFNWRTVKQKVSRMTATKSEWIKTKMSGHNERNSFRPKRKEVIGNQFSQTFLAVGTEDYGQVTTKVVH